MSLSASWRRCWDPGDLGASRAYPLRHEHRAESDGGSLEGRHEGRNRPDAQAGGHRHRAGRHRRARACRHPRCVAGDRLASGARPGCCRPGLAGGPRARTHRDPARGRLGADPGGGGRPHDPAGRGALPRDSPAARNRQRGARGAPHDVVCGLRHIRVGDKITLTTPKGAFRCAVERIGVVDPADVSVLDSSTERVLTLVTCYPFDFEGSAPKRFIVRAQAVPVARPAPKPGVEAGGAPPESPIRYQ